ncbi:oxidoreductase, aldo/keto reductase family [Verrucomicrobiia bacterium DG1235]|nr:oxidoreductase, aldo/keto reductase family [Verrucomicrobiae bacterium DG1235]
MLGLGTYDLRGAEGAASVRTAIELGYRHVDTAATYENEEAVGEGIRSSKVARDQIFLTTKVDRANLRTSDFIGSAEASLAALGCDYVDLLLVHWPNAEIPIEETLAGASELVAAGKTRFIGVSNFTRPRLKALLKASDLPLVTNQVEYHAHLNQRGLLRLCEENGVLLTAYSPLGQGSVLKDETICDIAKRIGRSPAQVALRWLLQKGVAVIPKSSSAARMRENLGMLDFELDRVEMERIESIGVCNRVIDWWPGTFEEDPDVFA